MATKSMLEELSDEQQTNGQAAAAAAPEIPFPAAGVAPETGAPAPAKTEAQAPVVTAPAAEVVDINAIISEKTANKYKTVDELLNAVEKPVYAELNFANETSKKVFDFLKEGKVDEFISVYQEKQLLSSLDKMSPEEVILTKIKYENPELTKEEIAEEFNMRYGVEKPDIDKELDDPADIAKAEKKYEKELAAAQRIMKKDLKEAKDFLSQKNEQIVLPDIQPAAQAPAPEPDNGESQRQIQEIRTKYEESILPAMNGFGEFESTYSDDDVNVQTKFVVDAAEKEALTTELKDFYIMDYFGSKYIKESGEFDTKQIANDLYALRNMNKIIEAHVSQAVQQTKSQLIKGIKNTGFHESGNAARKTDEVTKKQDEMVDYFFSKT